MKITALCAIFKIMSETKKFFRKDHGHHIIAGVCAGLGDYFQIDPVIIRVVFVLLTLFHGAGILLYVIFAIIVPKETGEVVLSREHTEEAIAKAKKIKEKVKQKASWLKDTRRVIGVLCVLAGAGALINKFFFKWFQWDLLWMIILVVLGLYLVITEPKKVQKVS